MPAASSARRYTADETLAFPDDEMRYELILEERFGGLPEA